MSLKRQQKKRKGLSLDVAQNMGVKKDTSTREERFASRKAKFDAEDSAREPKVVSLRQALADADNAAFRPNVGEGARRFLTQPSPSAALGPAITQDVMRGSTLPPPAASPVQGAASLPVHGGESPVASVATTPARAGGAPAPGSPISAEPSQAMLDTLPVQGYNPLEAQASGAPPSAPGQEQMAPGEAPLSERLMEAALASMTKGQAPPEPPGMDGALFSKSERLMAGLLAALNPEAYQAMVLPELQRRTRAREFAATQAANADKTGDKDTDRLLRAAQVSGTLEASRETRGAKAKALTDEQEGFEEEIGAAAQALTMALAPIPSDDGTEMENGVSATIRTLQSTGDPYDAAIAATILTRVQRVSAAIARAQAPGAVLRKGLVDDIKKQMEGLNDDLSAQLVSARSNEAAGARMDAAQARFNESTALRAATQARLEKQRTMLGPSATRTIQNATSALKNTGILTAMMKANSALFKRTDKYQLPRSEEYKRFRAIWQGARGQLLLTFAGKAQAMHEIGRLSAFIEDPGSPYFGDMESIRTSIEAMQTFAANDYIAELDTQEANGKDVRAFRQQFNDRVIPLMFPAVIQRFLPLPPGAPEGAVLIDYSPLLRRYLLPDGSIIPWTPDVLEPEMAAEEVP